ncbi:POMK (predicted) [Pycnogonum litorale]
MQEELVEYDFQLNIQRLKELRTPLITQLIGVCNDTFMTEYHPIGSATCLRKTPKDDRLRAKLNSTRRRFLLCLDYVQVIDYLHDSPVGTLAMCDSNSVDKTLTQFLISDDLRMVLNDVDCTPLVDKSIGIHCDRHKRKISGSLLAPEQRWPFPTKKYDPKIMPLYDEKIDIWRIPFVFDAILSRVDGENIKKLLEDVHRKCKNKDPKKRPSSKYVLNEYYKVKKLLGY